MLHRSRALTTYADLPSGGRGVETLGTSKHRPTPGCRHRSSPVHFGVDVWRGFDGIHHEQPRRGQVEPCGCPFYHVCDELTSSLVV